MACEGKPLGLIDVEFGGRMACFAPSNVGEPPPTCYRVGINTYVGIDSAFG
jgi:hypothetical protein